MKPIKTTMALLLTVAALTLSLQPARATAGTGTSSPAPTPIPVQVVANGDEVIAINNIPTAVIEALRVSIVNSGAFAFPSGQESRPVKGIVLNPSGPGKFSGRITLGPVPSTP